MTRAPKRKPQWHIERALNKYTHWAMKDGGVDQIWATFPLFEIATVSRDVSSTVLETKTLTKLGRLHNLWKSTLGSCAATQPFTSSSSNVIEVPTLYAVSASHTIMAFVRYLPPTKENRAPGLGLIAMFDFGKEGFDVWNALAVAIFVVHCRNRMMQLKEYLPEPDVPLQKDPDL